MVKEHYRKTIKVSVFFGSFATKIVPRHTHIRYRRYTVGRYRYRYIPYVGICTGTVCAVPIYDRYRYRTGYPNWGLLVLHKGSRVQLSLIIHTVGTYIGRYLTRYLGR